MDKIDSFVITGVEFHGSTEFNFIVKVEDIPEYAQTIEVDYIEHLVHKLNKKIPQFKFGWEEAHQIKPSDIYEEIVHQIIVEYKNKL